MWDDPSSSHTGSLDIGMANKESVKTIQELLHHANFKGTMDE
jgi:hypothetical protein